MKDLFRVELLDEATEFIEKLDQKTRDKVFYNLKKASKKQDSELFKQLDNEIWYFRTLYNKQKIRLFAFWDKNDTLVIATHGIIKKSYKPAIGEINRAKYLRTKYLNNKYSK
ncbi:MAG: type II toxin-antitoxin system RelE/ParE family toxin [Saprospiraceae bacterium]